MFRAIKRIGRRVLNVYLKRICLQEFRDQRFSRFNERPVELAFVFRHQASLYPKTVLDVGTGRTALPQLIRNGGALVTAIDNIRDYWSHEVINRHYHVIDDDICESKLSSEFDLVTCVSVLEHIQDADAAVRHMVRLTASGGHLLLTFPYSPDSYVPNVYALEGSSYGQTAPYVTQAFDDSRIASWQRENRLRLVDVEYWRFWEGAHWTQGQQIIPPRRQPGPDGAQLACLLFARDIAS